MRLPQTIDELEARLWSLAGERMAEEPLSDVLAHASHVAEGLLHEIAPSWGEPVSTLFTTDAFESRGLDDDEWGAIVRTLFSWAGAMGIQGFVQAIDGFDGPPPVDKVGLGSVNGWLKSRSDGLPPKNPAEIPTSRPSCRASLTFIR